MSETIAVLIPMYNREKYIKESITSILEQTYKDLIIQVYDDGSTDKSVDIVNSFKDSRIKLTVGEKNRGVSFARNKLLELCETKYAAWQDSDDVSNIYRLEIQYESIRKTNKLIYSRYDRLVGNVKNVYREIPKQIINTSTANASVMFPVDKIILFNENLPIGEDVDWHHRMVPKYEEEILNQVLYYIRYHPDRLGVKYRGFKWWEKVKK